MCGHFLVTIFFPPQITGLQCALHVYELLPPPIVIWGGGERALDVYVRVLHHVKIAPNDSAYGQGLL